MSITLLIKYLKADINRNRSNYKAIFILFFFRLTSAIYLSNSIILKIIGLPAFVFYRVVIEWILGVEIPWGTKIGEGLRIDHGQATVINRNVIIGKYCLIRHCTTIGNKGVKGNCPVIGDHVDIGANSVMIGDIKIGDNVKIGAGCVLDKDIPDGSVVVGNPGRII